MEIFRILQGPERLEIDRRRYLKYLEEMCSVENLWFGLQESRGLVVASESRPTDQLRTVLRKVESWLSDLVIESYGNPQVQKEVDLHSAGSSRGSRVES